MKMHFLAAGLIRMRKSIYITGVDRSETFDAPVSSALIRHPQGNLLFDTGCHPSVTAQSGERWGPLLKVMQPLMGPQDNLIASLQAIGIVPDDIDIVVNSHFHPDHCGCNECFRKASVLAHENEIAAATGADADQRGYLRQDWDHPMPIEGVAGQRDVFGDGKIILVPLPGHTPGTMGAIVNLDRDGTFLLVSDAVSLRQNFDEGSAPRNTWNAEALIASYAEIRKIEATGATLICGHDPAQWAGLRKGAEYYA